MPRRLRRAVITSVRRKRDWEASEHGVCTSDDVRAIDFTMMKKREISSAVIIHQYSQSSLRRLGHPKNNVVIRHQRHAHASKRALEAAEQLVCLPTHRPQVLSDRGKYRDGRKRTSGMGPW